MGIPQRYTQPFSSCSDQFSAKEFFRDCPWLNIPLRRRGEILIEPLYPRGGLRGGGPGEAAPKVSKLAALAAARKRKENDKESIDGPKPINTSVSLLSKLNLNGVPPEKQKAAAESSDDSSRKKLKTNAIESSSTTAAAAKETRKYPKKVLRSATPPPEPRTKRDQEPAPPENSPEEPPPVFAKPSSFARTMFGSSLAGPTLSERLAPSSTNRFSPAYAFDINFTESNPFAGPSPDDVVAKAQSASKGSKKQVKKG